MTDNPNEIGVVGLDEDGAPVIKEPIFINISEFRNNKYLNIRKYYEIDGEWRPTKKGIALGKEQFEQLLEILKNNEERIRKSL